MKPVSITCSVVFWLVAGIASAQEMQGKLRITSRSITVERPVWSHAYYTEPAGTRLARAGSVSEDNGRTWKPFAPTPDFSSGLPYGYRRDQGASVVDAKHKRFVLMVDALDTPGLDPKAIEPPIALKEYYLRYRVSNDGGRTWAFDEPVVHAGGTYNEREPFDGIRRGVNCIMTGDCGTFPIISQKGRILFPAQATVMKDGKVWNPFGTTSFTDVFVLLGTWKDDGHIAWKSSPRLQIELEKSTRGLIEPTLVQFDDGRLLMVMRGSNAGKPELPGYRWFSTSKDDGETWSPAEPWRYDDGETFYSPSSMSTLMRHSSGRVFWVGNISPTNSNGNDPRHPAVMGEVDAKSHRLIRSSVIELDTKRPEDEARGFELTGQRNERLDLSHFWVIEDRETKEFVITYPRAFGGYNKQDWAMLRVAMKQAE